MDSLSSIRDFYHLHRRAVHRYGLLALFFIAALGTGRGLFALLIFLAAPIMYAYDRWGEPWRKRGETMMKTKPKS